MKSARLMMLALPASATPSGATGAQTPERVRAGGAMRVCSRPDCDGLTYRNPRTGQLGGIDIDQPGVAAH